MDGRFGDRDLFKTGGCSDDMQDWVVANENMAKVIGPQGLTNQSGAPETPGHEIAAEGTELLPQAGSGGVWRVYKG